MQHRIRSGSFIGAVKECKPRTLLQMLFSVFNIFIMDLPFVPSDAMIYGWKVEELNKED